MSTIDSLTARKVLNSRGHWTVMVELCLEDGTSVTQTVPEGASKGENEAISVSVEDAVRNVNIDIAPSLMGQDPTLQEEVDQLLLELDGTENKSNLGCNAILPVSLAVAKAAAKSKGMKLYKYLRDLHDCKGIEGDKFPTPVFNILNGGKHAQNGLSFQEFMIIPAMNYSYERKVEIGVECYQVLKDNLAKDGYSTGLGDEGGFAPKDISVTQALERISSSIEAAGYALGKDVFLGMDVAAGSFYNVGKKVYDISEEGKVLNTPDFMAFYDELMQKFPLIYIEDPLFETDFSAWSGFFEKFGKRTLVVGDDLVVTNTKFLQQAIEAHSLNAVIVKPNQVGTLSETLNFIRLAQENNLSLCVSHRSGETAEDTFVADLALAVGSEFVKFGAPARGERVVKYNRLLSLI